MTFDDGLLTYEDVDRLPYDGTRQEIVAGRYYTSAVPPMEHQEILGAILLFLGERVYVPRLGKVLPGILNVRFSVHDQVQPDIIVILGKRNDPCGDFAVCVPPDLIVEVVTPATKQFDEILKRRLYAEMGIPEYWIADPTGRTLRIFSIRAGRYVPVAPDRAGAIRSALIPGIVVDPAEIFANLDRW